MDDVGQLQIWDLYGTSNLETEYHFGVSRVQMFQNFRKTNSEAEALILGGQFKLPSDNLT